MSILELTFLKPFVNMLEVECLSQVGRQNFQVVFGKGFAEADTHSTVERRKTSSITLFAIRGQTQFTSVVKTLRDELSRSLPLTFIDVKAVKKVRDYITFFKLVVSKLAVILEKNWCLN